MVIPFVYTEEENKKMKGEKKTEIYYKWLIFLFVLFCCVLLYIVMIDYICKSDLFI